MNRRTVGTFPFYKIGNLVTGGPSIHTCELEVYFLLRTRIGLVRYL